tara:strand:+ start:2804 stop:3703 length:900 start_codon:yes stop_codon:yes gene_type:complete
MIYICAQPSWFYYSWQIDIMLYSFKELGLFKKNTIQIVLGYKTKPHKNFKKLEKKYPQVEFFYYPDTRYNSKYVSSIRPHLMYKHWVANPELKEETIFYHDCDIVLTRKLNLPEDDVCYLSDTKSYIGYEYIKGKGDDVLDLMSKVADIDKRILKEKQDQSGGAQYVLKGIDRSFWLNVYNDSEKLFESVTGLNLKKKENDPNYHELQIWCADMWAVLWNLWKQGKETEIIEEMNFTWATNKVDDWEKNAIYHNAGVTDTESGMFYKAIHQKELPPNDLKIDKKRASSKYYELLCKALY